MPAYLGRTVLAKLGKFFGDWLHATPPARRARSEIRAPDTLVDITSYATADVGSIPTVSITIGRIGVADWHDLPRRRLGL